MVAHSRLYDEMGRRIRLVIKIPRLIVENKAMYPVLVCMHVVFSILLLTRSLMHLGVALYHRYVTKDHFYVWKRTALPGHRCLFLNLFDLNHVQVAIFSNKI